MLRPRVIPCLLMTKGALVKTVRFDHPKYVGDPLNAVRTFNEKGVDELMVLDIDATKDGGEPPLDIVRQLASECQMPLCYGGGVRTIEHAQRLVQLGVEKIAVCSAAHETPELVSAMAQRLGSQSVVVVLDVKYQALPRRHEVLIRKGTVATGKTIEEAACDAERRGAGEIVINSIDRDGTMMGYDLEAARAVRAAVKVPITVLGGASSLQDIATLVREFGRVGAGAGSLFVFKGKYRAVLINYPRPNEKQELLQQALLAHAQAGSGGQSRAVSR